MRRLITFYIQYQFRFRCILAKITYVFPLGTHIRIYRKHIMLTPKYIMPNLSNENY